LSNKPDSDKLHSNKFGEREKQAPIIYQTARKRTCATQKQPKNAKLFSKNKKTHFKTPSILNLSASSILFQRSVSRYKSCTWDQCYYFLFIGGGVSTALLTGMTGIVAGNSNCYYIIVHACTSRYIFAYTRVARWYIYFQTKNPELVKFWRALAWKSLVFYGHLEYITSIGNISLACMYMYLHTHVYVGTYLLLGASVVFTI
jgi:hypothetical protein